MSTKHTFPWVILAAVALSVTGCASDVDADEEIDLGETSDEVRAGGIHVTNPNTASYADLDSALQSWVDWACMVSAGQKAKAVAAQFKAKQAATPKGTRVNWLVYGKYLNGDTKCIVSYNVELTTGRLYPPIIPLDHRNRPLATYKMGYFMGTK